LTIETTALSSSLICSNIDETILEKIDLIDLLDVVTSTSDHLWDRLKQGHEKPAICITEQQTAGRGRRGDQWHSPASGNLYLSISWPFPANTELSGLSIAIGISLINTLKSYDINDLKLKWPNDVLYERQKLAGILVESRFGKQQNTVIGIGLNYKLPSAIQNKINQPTTSLSQLCASVPCRNRLAGHIIQTMIETLEQFQTSGLRDFMPFWSQYDALKQTKIQLIDENETIDAIACGINEKGELLYLHNDQVRTLSNSHVSIRFAS
jgi:BirA family biotin operon repressor/biotin-[acetyl-CoA-carboxylase] ligase